ncbi:MAG: Frizzy aggregation protein FrzB [Myxococcaceae bacterium]|nr:Frizzy aggregation protein FrzB [Myxococcaceae bacterium]
MTSTVDILVFEVAGVRFAADASQVVRIDRAVDEASVGAPLGMPAVGLRALVFRAGDGGLRRLDIDKVSGVKTVAIESLRRLPPPARVGHVPIGAWLDGDEAVLLVDLERMAGT